MSAGQGNNTEASQLHRRLFYAKWEESSQQPEGNNNNNDNEPAAPVPENPNSVIMLFDSPTHWHDGEYERATQDQQGGAAANANNDNDEDAEQQILAMERTMEAMSRRYMDNVVNQMRGNNNEDEEERPARIMIGGLGGGAMLMGGGGPPFDFARNMARRRNAVVDRPPNNVAAQPAPPPRPNNNEEPPRPDAPPADNANQGGAAAAQGIGRALGDLMRRALRGMGGGRNNNQRPPRRRPREEAAGNDERPRRRPRRQAREPPAAAMMVEVRMVQGPDGRLVPIMPNNNNNNPLMNAMMIGGPPPPGGDNNNNNGAQPNGNNADNNNNNGPDPFHNMIADALNQALGQIHGGPPAPPPQQGANQNNNNNNEDPPQQGENQNNNDEAPPQPNQNEDNGNDDNNNNNNDPAQGAANQPPPAGANNNNPHQAIGEAIAQAIRQAMMGAPANNNNNAAAANNNNNNAAPNNNNNGPPRPFMPRPFRVNVNLRNANDNNNAAGANNNNDNQGPARVGFGAIPMPIFDFGQVVNQQQTHPKWTLDQLRQTLEQRHETATTLHLDVMEGSWDAMTLEDWKQTCTMLSAALPNVTKIQVTYVEHLKDAKWAMLLSHFPNITSLKFKHIGPMPLTFRQIGHLKRLDQLSLQDDTYARSSSRGLCPVASIALAKALLKLKSLSHLTMKHLIMQDPRACWIPLLKSIRKMPTLAQIQVNGGWQQRPAGNRPGAPLICHRINLSASNLEKMQYGPRICAARKEHLASDEPTMINWIDALASVNDRFDCVHYFLTQMDPSDLSRAGLEGAVAKEARTVVEIEPVD
ncbi:expressed unknown protein [Seminavis robusta]|uniref:Uncharacterized protein n=1 Tax=Seminavis robusta TaxID=568900 RepID=A0A9N8HIW9_9STRA|nr:expressed unknown protein [Seminavis robusta]|eukprot:Sro815_g206430.2  (812) ;mRNA; f:2359-4794